jgi:hypothetical protein
MNILKDIEIKPMQFYFIGKYAFLVSALMSLVRTVNLLLNKGQAYDIISGFSSFVFQMGLFGLFCYFLNNERKMVKTDDDILKYAELLENGEKRGGKDGKRKDIKN